MTEKLYEMLRFTIMGFILIFFIGIFLYSRIFKFNAVLLIFSSYVLGLIFSPVARKYHPFRNRIKTVIDHTKEIMKGKSIMELPSEKYENALARAIYDYVLLSKGKSHFIEKIHRDVGFFYFYLYIYYLFIFGIGLGLISFTIKILAISGYLSSNLSLRIKDNFFLGINNLWELIILLLALVVLLYFFLTISKRTAEARLDYVLNMQHVFVANNKGIFQEVFDKIKDNAIIKKIGKIELDKEGV